MLEKYTARSSRSKVLYRDSAGLSFLEKYEMGRQPFPMYCWRTAPAAMSEASVMMLVGASGFGCERRVALARASLIVAKAAVAFSLHSIVLVLPLEVESSSLSG